MLRIVIPQDNIPERTYLLDVLFTQFLKISYSTVVSEEKIDAYYIYLENGKSIIIKDAFFSLYPNSLEYLDTEAIPKNIDYYSSPIFMKEELPVLFGVGKIETTPNNITSHIDIFAIVFFMLTRWEELVLSTRDEHNRFQAIDSLAFKFGFLDRPIVNEYIDCLWSMLVELGFKEHREKHNFSICLTHDVDEIVAYPTPKKFLKKIVGDVIVRKNPKLAIERVYDYIIQKQDPYDTFDELMDISDKYGLTSHFFFMSGGVTKYDNRYDIESSLAKALILKIKKRGHTIGFHPSYNAYNDFEQFKREKDTLKFTTSLNIISGREHYLRFEVPKTWQIWEDNNMEWCSNMAYADHSGFRSGVCYAYTPFNILTREQLKLKERPLIVMEVTLIEESNSVEEFEKSVYYYLDMVKKYAGEFVFLWHNSNFKSYEDFSRDKIKKYASIYEKTIKKYGESPR